jgi:hypothetical protein
MCFNLTNVALMHPLETDVAETILSGMTLRYHFAMQRLRGAYRVMRCPFELREIGVLALIFPKSLAGIMREPLNNEFSCSPARVAI